MTEIKRITCPKCNGLIPEHLGQCPVCGEQLKKCPACGKIYVSNAKFCPIDGSQLIYSEKMPAKNTGSVQSAYNEQNQNSNPQNTNRQTQNSSPQNNNWQGQNSSPQNNNWQGQNYDQRGNSGQGPVYKAENQTPNNNQQHNTPYNPNNYQPNTTPDHKQKKLPVVGIVIAVCVIAVLCIAGIFAFQSSKGNATASTSTSGSAITTPTEGKSTNAVSTSSTASEDFDNGLLTTETSKEIDKSKDYEDDGAYILWSDKKHVGKLCTIKIYTPGGYLLRWTDDTRETLDLESSDYANGYFEICSTEDILSDIDDERRDAAELNETINDEQTCKTNVGTVHYVSSADDSYDFVCLECWLECDKNTSLYLSYSTEGTAENLKDTEKVEQIITEIFNCVGQKPDDEQTNAKATKFIDDDANPDTDENGAYVLESNDDLWAEYNLSNVSIYTPDHCLLSWVEDDHTFLSLSSDDGWNAFYSLDPIDFLEYQSDYFDMDGYTSTGVRSCETDAGTISYMVGESDNMFEVYSWLQYDDTTILIFQADYNGNDLTFDDTEEIESFLRKGYSGVR